MDFGHIFDVMLVENAARPSQEQQGMIACNTCTWYCGADTLLNMMSRDVHPVLRYSLRTDH